MKHRFAYNNNSHHYNKRIVYRTYCILLYVHDRICHLQIVYHVSRYIIKTLTSQYRRPQINIAHITR